jgi:hypothetical protein
MEKAVKIEILKMLIPVIGTWWLIKRIIPDFREITWWDCSNYALPLACGISFYQAICWIVFKLLCNFLTT